MGSQVNLPGRLYRLFYINRMSYDINIQNVFMYGNRVGGCIYFYRRLNNNYIDINFLKTSELSLLPTQFYTISRFFIHTVS